MVLDEIYRRGIQLPDLAQELIADASIKPDFVYKTAKITIFCDSSVHDSPEKQKQDRIDRDNLRYQAGYRVIALRHDEDWQSQLDLLSELF